MAAPIMFGFNIVAVFDIHTIHCLRDGADVIIKHLIAAQKTAVRNILANALSRITYFRVALVGETGSEKNNVRRAYVQLISNQQNQAKADNAPVCEFVSRKK
ncbi:unnamed protein product [Gongylonema pulchrum]|uniref:Myosin motor domain-containing protein n=1 Tax=Gongylonema pulchrum TaxID=637853 RepID=A0A183E9Y6_9BILA|nr:unnamed protein product [Gongylonema pulchrum]